MYITMYVQCTYNFSPVDCIARGELVCKALNICLLPPFMCTRICGVKIPPYLVQGFAANIDQRGAFLI